MGSGADRICHHVRSGLQHRTAVMAVIDFTDLQSLSGYRQVSKVIEWLREHRVKNVVGGDGKPRTTDDFLREAIDGETGPKKAAPVLFGR